MVSIIIHIDQLRPANGTGSSAWQASSEFAEDYLACLELVRLVYRHFGGFSDFVSACREEDSAFDYVLRVDRLTDDGKRHSLVPRRLCDDSAVIMLQKTTEPEPASEDLKSLLTSALSQLDAAQRVTFAENQLPRLKRLARFYVRRLSRV